MKNLLYIKCILSTLFCGSTLLFINSCCEVGPPIDFSEILLDTTYVEGTIETPQQKVVLMEDFTGAACPNCPYAHEKIAELVSANPGKIAVTAIYSYFADPLNTDEDFTNADAYALDDYLGPAPANPATAIDRTDFGTGFFNFFPDDYAGYVSTQLALTPPCNIYITEKSFNDETNELVLNIKIKYTSALSTVNHLTVYATENNIIAAQLDETEEIEDYEHNHVLRDAITSVFGLDLVGEKIPGRVFEKEFPVILSEDWVKSNMEIIAFVHNYEPGVNEVVLQAAVLELD